MNWNIRGINSEKKWSALSNKIDECGCDIICLQETKRQSFDHQYLQKLCPRRLSKFAYLPSIGASGGILIVWNDAIFKGELLFQKGFLFSCPQVVSCTQFSSAP
jgi:hypothetical protein